MKTTVDIPDSLLDEVRKLAANRQNTVKALIEEGLRHVLLKHKRKGKFRLRKASFRGNGLQPNVAGGSWEQIRDMAYNGRGG